VSPRRALLVLAACALLVAAAAGAGFSGAFFRDTDTTSQTVSADTPDRWLHVSGDVVTAASPLPEGAATIQVTVKYGQLTTDGGTTDVVATLSPGETRHLSVDTGHDGALLRMDLADGSFLHEVVGAP
jgi:hypothetical protein